MQDSPVRGGREVMVVMETGIRRTRRGTAGLPPVVVVIALFALFALLVLSPREGVRAQAPAAQAPPDTARGTLHIVRSGDTLWDLAARYLNNPWSWPAVWRFNEQDVEDPHWIFPGQRLLIPVGGGPPVVLSFEEVWPGPRTETTQAAQQASRVPVTEPPAATPAGTEPPLAPTAATPSGQLVKVSGAGATSDRHYPLASPGAVLAAGYIGDPADWPEGRILDAERPQMNLSLYDQVFLDLGEDQAAVDDLFLVVEPGSRVRHSEWGHTLGRQIRVKGIIQVVDVEGRTSLGNIVAVYDAMRVKDRIIPAFPVDSRPWESFVPVQGGREGFVVARAKAEGNLHPYDMLFIDGGSEENLRVGDLYVIRRPENERGRLRFFQEELGRAVVIAVQPTTATVMLLSVHDSQIGVGEKIQLIGRSVFVEEPPGR